MLASFIVYEQHFYPELLKNDATPQHWYTVDKIIFFGQLQLYSHYNKIGPTVKKQKKNLPLFGRDAPFPVEIK
jgi:hypothetical protein